MLFSNDSRNLSNLYIIIKALFLVYTQGNEPRKGIYAL